MAVMGTDRVLRPVSISRCYDSLCASREILDHFVLVNVGATSAKVTDKYIGMYGRILVRKSGIGCKNCMV